MLRITVEVEAPVGQAIGVKEALAMELEKYGDTRVVSVEEVAPEQTSLLPEQIKRAYKWLEENGLREPYRLQAD